ncbi:SPOR domain-containing protein [Halopseudomonas laoshanensis]|jgi:cell division protein FtsN|uniref:SPOR domain-containing protein n=1 Tax=Halopseudomonas laoshanensis TaxID=2268758 RepID=A0A7V7KUN0_9GAMM|nr:SPOR domain-containing protein [Halopseudomonas laoshanensis]KAA0693821.1 SPOR domain-containing protein [Halopseudomonas laoshanensis]MBQ0743552.1 SPOR domain-containing protein [Pseudomonas sp.]MBQ0778827.1 SPOR domain-containing protein [Pseudomonas sp.]WOD11070.1 SPOR domain-containing protein [Pseudomonas sp. NyZ704]
MAKARKAAPRRGASRQQSNSKRSIPGWLWLVAGLAIGVFVTFLFQLEPGRGSVQRDKTPPPPAVTPPPPSKADQPRYDFYTLLPESEVIVPQSSVPETAEPEKSTDEKKPEDAASASGTRFYLQAGSFRQRAEADRVRAQILLLGLDVKLENARLDGGEIWYRVQVGPFQDRATLSSAQTTLAGNGFDNLLLQQRTTP